MTNTRNIIELAAAARARNDEKNAKQDADSFAPIRADYERQIAERDAEIEQLRKKSEDRLNALVAEQEENKALKDEIVALKDELAASRQEAAAPEEQPATPEEQPAAPRKGRRK